MKHLKYCKRLINNYNHINDIFHLKTKVLKTVLVLIVKGLYVVSFHSKVLISHREWIGKADHFEITYRCKHRCDLSYIISFSRLNAFDVCLLISLRAVIYLLWVTYLDVRCNLITTKLVLSDILCTTPLLQSVSIQFITTMYDNN